MIPQSNQAPTLPLPLPLATPGGEPSRQPHDNYGPVIWGGTGERWDLLQLEKGGPPTGGEQLRQRVREILQGDQHQAPEPLRFLRASTIEARSEPLATQLDEHGSSWALAPVILTGILREGRAWCRVLEFAEEFGISASFAPFALGERRGG